MYRNNTINEEIIAVATAANRNRPNIGDVGIKVNVYKVILQKNIIVILVISKTWESHRL